MFVFVYDGMTHLHWSPDGASDAATKAVSMMANTHAAQSLGAAMDSDWATRQKNIRHEECPEILVGKPPRRDCFEAQQCVCESEEGKQLVRLKLRFAGITKCIFTATSGFRPFLEVGLVAYAFMGTLGVLTCTKWAQVAIHSWSP